MKDQRLETLKHINQVRKLIKQFNEELYYRGRSHDTSKLESPEREIFDEYTPKLKNTTYGSIQYKEYLREMKVALDHHYAENRHHPEHFSKTYKCEDCGSIYAGFQDECDTCKHLDSLKRVCDISKMNLVDIIEMICDWKAATMRHADGDIKRSIEINKKRFGYGDELEAILLNTVGLLEERNE